MILCYMIVYSYFVYVTRFSCHVNRTTSVYVYSMCVYTICNGICIAGGVYVSYPNCTYKYNMYVQ